MPYFLIALTFPSSTRLATRFPGSSRILVTSLPPTPKHQHSSNVIVKNSIRKLEWAAWRFESLSNRKLDSKRAQLCKGPTRLVGRTRCDKMRNFVALCAGNFCWSFYVKRTAELLPKG